MSQHLCRLPVVALVSGLLAVAGGAQEQRPNVLLLAVDGRSDDSRGYTMSLYTFPWPAPRANPPAPDPAP